MIALSLSLSFILLAGMACGFFAAYVQLRQEYKQRGLRFKAALDELLGTQVEHLKLQQRTIEVQKALETANGRIVALQRVRDLCFDKFVWWHDRALVAEKRVAELEAGQQELQSALDMAQQESRRYKTRWQVATGKPLRKKKGSK